MLIFPLFGALMVAAATAQVSPGQRTVPGAGAGEAQLIEQVSGTSFALLADTFEHAKLTVSGPNGFRAVQEFESTDSVSIDLLLKGRRVIEGELGVDEKVFRLEDGRYRYELVTLDSSGRPSKAAGIFMASGGVAVSRDTFRSSLFELRRKLAASSGTDDAGLQTKVSATYRADDFIAVDDTGGATGTSLYLDSDTPVAAEWWDLSNVNGDLDIREFSSFDTRLFLDRSTNHIGLGTTTPAGSLHITDSTIPEIILEPTGGTRWEIEASTSRLAFYDGAFSRMFAIENGGRTNQLVLDSGGNIGIGTQDPSATLEIEDATGTAQFLVDQQGADAAVEVMFNLVCNCAPAFRMQNSTNGQVWFFRHTAAGSFSFDDPGSAGLEMLLTSAGNLTIKGSLSQGSSRALKENLEEPDGESILSALDDLDLYEWSYKDASARHFGPMAEDFAEAFGLGEQRSRLAPADVAGVALAAVKELKDENQDLREELRLLMERVAQLEKE